MSLTTNPGEATLPFRRSCDRCHDQKVRCIRTQEPSHPVPDSEPCVRCKRSGSICVFSPQQKPGRPPLGSDTTSPAMYSRKRPRQSLSSVDLPQSPPSTYTPPVTSLPDSASVVGSLSLDPMLFSPFTTGDELGDCSTSFSHSDFLVPIPTMSSIDSMSSQKHRKCVSEGNAMHSNSDIIERDTAELGNLSLQVCRAAKAFSSSYPTSLAVSSPSLNEIFASTEALIRIIHRNTSGSSNNKYDPFSNAEPAGFGHQADWDEFNWFPDPPHHDWMLSQVPSTANRALDTSVVLMILACHQRLLTTLGGVLFYIVRHLQQQQQTQNLPIGASPFIDMPTTQALIIVNLVSHQLQRLDRAVGLLAEDGGAAKRQPGPAARTAATQTLSPVSPEQSKSPQSISDIEDQSSQNKLRAAANGDSDELGNGTSLDSSSSGSHKAITSAIDMMKHRQEQLLKQIKTVKQQIRSFD